MTSNGIKPDQDIIIDEPASASVGIEMGVSNDLITLKPLFDKNIIRNYPRSNRKVNLEVAPYSLVAGKNEDVAVQSIHISPFGLEFQSQVDFVEGSLVRVNVSIPNYWMRKQQFVEYRRIDAPDKFRVLGKVVATEEVGKRGKKKLITIQTVNIDEIDEKVLKSFLQEG